jgi:hypothetical protein
MAVVAVPFLVNRQNLKYSWIFAVVIIMPYLPLIDDGLHYFYASLVKFSRDFAFNGSIHGLLRVVCGEIGMATSLCKLLVLAFLGIGLKYLHPEFSRRFQGDPAVGCFYALGMVLLLAPTVHFWYLTWIIPFLPLFASRSWMVLCLTISLVFISNGNLHHTGVFILPVWAQIAIWLPFYLLLIGEGVVFFRRQAETEIWPAPKTISVVIPTQNEAKNIGACLGSVKMDDIVHEIIVVDSASIDETIEIAEQAGAQVVRHDFAPDKGGGRGGQIAAGLGIAQGDVVAVVHADTRIPRSGFSRILQILQRNPSIIGGALGGVFDDPGWRMRLIGFLNDCRSVFLGISFGDQVQFFRRQPVVKNNIFPSIP